MKPLLKYRGGKSKEIPHIEKYLPQSYENYVEPFFGGGALYFHLEPKTAIINDINKPLVSFYEGIKSNFDTVKKELEDIEIVYRNNRKDFDKLRVANPDIRNLDNNESLYYSIRNMFNGKSKKKYSDATIYYFINKTSYLGMVRVNKKGEFNVSYGRYKNFDTSLITKKHNELLQNTRIFNKSFEDIFLMANKEDFVFLDPPYDSTFKDYGNSSTFDKKEHEKLLSLFENTESKAMIVLGKTDLTYPLYKKYIKSEYDKSYDVNIRNRFKSESVHFIATNY